MFISCRALDMITNQFGSVAAATVRNLDIEKLPLLALVYRLRGTTEIFQVRRKIQQYGRRSMYTLKNKILIGPSSRYP